MRNKEIFKYEDGFVNIPKGPGLGIDIDEELVEKINREGLHWTNPKWKNYDGTVAEWK